MDLLKNLNAEEQQQLTDAIAYITVLVAGADGNIDPKEIAAAEKVTQIRSFSYLEELRPYYEQVGKGYTQKLNELIENLPAEVAERQQAISGELSKLNAILDKLDLHLGHVLYESFVSFANHVAKASGGFLGTFAIGNEEKKVVDLPMLDPIIE
ncbi:MAG: hypothetical protein AAF242_04400 [Bacteroidota bacterium]